MDTFFDLMGVLYAVVGLGIAWTLYRRPLTDGERPWFAAIVATVALAALAYRLGNLTPA